MRRRLFDSLDPEIVAGLLLLIIALAGYGLQGMLFSVVITSISGRNPVWTFLVAEAALLLVSLFVVRLTGQRR